MKKRNKNENLVGTVILAVTLIFLFLFILSSFIANNYHMGMMNWNYGITFGILIIITLILVILWLNKQLKK